MSTRSTIWVTLPDGSVKGVYCHNDGYPSYNGRLLLDHHNNGEAAAAIVALGAISSLESNLYPLPEAELAYFYGDGKAPILLAHEHKFGNKQKDVTVAYHRDRGDKFEQLEGFCKKPDPSFFEEWQYWYNKGKWYVKKGTKNWSVLTHDYITRSKS